jgi:hypothetical protein
MRASQPSSVTVNLAARLGHHQPKDLAGFAAGVKFDISHRESTDRSIWAAHIYDDCAPEP